MFDILVITPFERPDVRLVQALSRSAATPVLDLGRDDRLARQALARLGSDAVAVRVPEGVAVPTLPAHVHTVVVSASHDTAAIAGRRILVEVRTVAEAQAAIAHGAAGVIGIGHESGGRVGPESAFVLCQHLADAALQVPFWIMGGIGPHTAAACVAAGAHGVVLSAQVAGARETSLPEAVKRAVLAMDGTETTVIGGHRVFSRPDLPLAQAKGLTPEQVQAHLGADSLTTQLIPVGQDGALAAPLAATFRTAGAIVAAVREAVLGHLEAAASLDPLGPDSPLARDQGTTYPIVQGPMTRVSDLASFADAVATGGGLPFVALSMMRGPQSQALLEETAALLGDKPWGVGILGFVPAELRDPQLAAIAAVKPPFALIAGGRPSQARELEQAGIRTWLHTPSPALLDAFLADGARRFIFEGNECGGHVGPRASFVLWHQQIDRLLAFGKLTDVQVLFAGGIHDARSAAMVAAMAAPLAQAGAQVGVLMGTAYLFTEEAVSSGAIQQGFQDAAVQAEVTALVETAPGHATRCVDTEFVRHFEAERARLTEAGTDPKAMWAALEQLNLGRLRIASKGLVREGRELKAVDAATQRDQGMFMIGEVAALRHGVTTIAALHHDVSAGAAAILAAHAPAPAHIRNAPPPADIAIVGMACVFPDAPDVDTFWRHTLEGHDAVREIPPERWRADLYYDPEGTPGITTPSKWGGLLPQVRFDPLQYGIPPRSLAAIDPAQLLALDVARQALEDAGYADRAFDRGRTSVIFGTESGSDLGGAYSFRAHFEQFVGPMPEALDNALPRLSEDSFPGVLANVLAGRIANRLDLGGVNYTVDAACASSLAAVDLGLKELAAGTSDVVLCGGADMHNGINDYLLFSSVHALSPTGRCKTFDASADGIVLGEGVACVVLKRLADAERDGDRIYAVIRGVGGSSDGRSLGLTAPRKEGQKRAVERAWAHAGVDPSTVGLVEAHGTGTVVGDRTEMQTLTEMFEGQASDVTLGSVKSQIGHTKCAAGLAGIIKTTLAVYHGVRPPTSQVVNPNPAWKPEASPFRFRSVPAPWSNTRRVAAVSAFGFGGTNFHAVLEAHQPRPERPRTQSAEIFLFRGDDKAVDRTLDQLAARLDDVAPAALAVLAKATTFASHGPIRLAVIATSHADLRAQIAAARARKPVEGHVYVAAEAPEGEVALLFPGQGSQRPGMLRDLFLAYPQLQEALAAAPDLESVIFPPDAFDDATRKAQRDALTDTRAAQPALGVVDWAAATFLAGLGVPVTHAAGHSYGELAALAWAGAMDLPTLVAMSRARAQAILDAAPDDPGTMAAVSAPLDVVQAELADLPGVVVANHNAPRQSVIAGPTGAVRAACQHLEARAIAVRTIPVACAFHSPVVAAASAAFRTVLDGADLRAPDLTVWSNTTAAPHGATADGLRDLLARQIAEPVRFVDEIEAMYAAGVRVFVEAGPGRVLTGLVRKILGKRPFSIVTLETPGDESLAGLFAGVGALLAAGIPIDPDALFAGRDIADIALGKAPKASRNIWLVDGHLARPEQGELPADGLKPILEPLGGTMGTSLPVISEARDETVLSFLDNMQTIANAQRDAMLAYLGQAPAAPSAPRAPRPERQAAAATPAAPAPAPVPSANVPPVVDLLTTLLEVVSDRTGYPADMLDPDLDLEADLSIDSIKRIEILNALGERLGTEEGALGDDAIEALASRKTLRDMVDWLTDAGLAPDASVAAVPAASAGAPIDLLATLLEVVSDRTGYPADMLDPDLDLEADLSIDSIKRIEILNALGERMGPAAGTLDDDAIEALATRKTLRAMVDWLEGAQDTQGPATPEPAPEPEPAAFPVLRYRMTSQALPVDASGMPIRTKVALLDADAQRGEQVAERLRAEGLDVVMGGVDDASGADTVVHLDGLGPVAVFPELKQVLESGTRTVIGVDAGAGGLDGLYKTAAREYPERRVRLASMDAAFDIDAVAAVVKAELAQADGPSHVTWTGTDRATRLPELAPFLGDATSFPLDDDSVVLVTGGARGITARIAEAMAREVACTYVLVGRSPLSDVVEPPDIAAADDAQALRRAFVARGLRSPAAIESEIRKVTSTREVRATLQAIEDAGATVAYRALDVRDDVALGALLDELYAAHGRIDGVVHGAGVLEDKLMRDKSPESFERVFETKVAAARTLASRLKEDTRFVVFFGSISGVFGNRGQADYAAANATLDALAAELGDRISGRVVSIDWGPWGGAGMVSPELARAYAKRGIPLIPLEEGITAFLDELKRGTRDDRQIIWQAGPADAFAEDFGA